MAKNVRSKNQSGGITAETVNVDTAGDVGAPHQRENRGLHWLVAVAAIATIIATAIAVVNLI